MNFLAKTILLSVVLLFVGFSANGQNRTEEKAQAETDKLATALNLDEDMKAKVYEVQLASYKKQKDIKAEYKGSDDKEAKKAAMKKSRVESTVSLEAVLGVDLSKKYDAYKKTQKKQKGKSTKAPMAGKVKKPAKAKKAPNKKAKKPKYNPAEKAKEQSDKIFALMETTPGEATKTKIYDINTAANTSLKALKDEARAKKKAGEDINKEEAKAARKAISKKSNKEIKSLLGEEQYKAYNAAKKQIKMAAKNKKG